MRKLLTNVALLALMGAATTEAQVSRVFVASSGNDANDCLLPTTACRTLAGGILRVDAQGEVIVVDSGSYAGTTITKSVKIDVPSGVVAFSGIAIDSNPGANVVVVIRGITLKAFTPGTGTGLTVTSGDLFLENSVIDGWDKGVSAASGGRIFMKNSTIRNNATGLSVTTSSRVAIEGSQFENNGLGLDVSNGGRVAMTRAVISGSSVVGVKTSGAGSEVTAQFCQVAHNAIGMQTLTSGLARLSDSTVTGNVTGIDASAGTTFETFTSNVIRGNTANTSGTLTTVLLQ
jgi:hypothetical protein